MRYGSRWPLFGWNLEDNWYIVPNYYDYFSNILINKLLLKSVGSYRNVRVS